MCHRTAIVTLSLAALVCGFPAPAAAADGAALYASNCASCHGADGMSDTPVGKAMKASPIKGTSRDVAKFVRESAKHKAPSSKLGDEDLAAVAAYIKAM